MHMFTRAAINSTSNCLPSSSPSRSFENSRFAALLLCSTIAPWLLHRQQHHHHHHQPEHKNHHDPAAAARERGWEEGRRREEGRLHCLRWPGQVCHVWRWESWCNSGFPTLIFIVRMNVTICNQPSEQPIGNSDRIFRILVQKYGLIWIPTPKNGNKD